jgi:hypothetical protein
VRRHKNRFAVLFLLPAAIDSPAPPQQYTLRPPPQQNTLSAPTGGTACGTAAAALTSFSSSPSPPFTACATVAAASPSPPLDSSAPPQ